jgi:hypothetical protein
MLLTVLTAFLARLKVGITTLVNANLAVFFTPLMIAPKNYNFYFP